MDDPIQLLEEADGLKISVSPTLVGQPFPLIPAVVLVQHGGDRIDAEAVHVVATQPVVGGAEEERPNFVATEVEN